MCTRREINCHKQEDSSDRGRFLESAEWAVGWRAQYLHPARQDAEWLFQHKCTVVVSPDFNGWVKAGAVVWGWEDVAAAFKVQERWNGSPRARRVSNGPMHIAPNRNVRKLSRKFVESAKGYRTTCARGFNGYAYEGACFSPLTLSA